MSEPFDNAKVGDKVIFCHSGWEDMRELTTITKIGRFINVAHRGKDNFRLSGSSVGYLSGRIEPYDEKKWLDYLGVKLDERKRSDVRFFDWQNCDVDLIRKVYDLLPKPE